MVLVLLSYHKVVNLSVALSICPAYINSLYLLGTQNISKLTSFKIINNDFFSRLRPDIRKLELGDLDGAASEKTRLEEKQRESKKARKHKKGQEWIPR